MHVKIYIVGGNWKATDDYKETVILHVNSEKCRPERLIMKKIYALSLNQITLRWLFYEKTSYAYSQNSVIVKRDFRTWAANDLRRKNRVSADVTAIETRRPFRYQLVKNVCSRGVTQRKLGRKGWCGNLRKSRFQRYSSITYILSIPISSFVYILRASINNIMWKNMLALPYKNL